MRRRVEIEDARLLRPQHGALEQAGQEAVAPVVHAVHRVSARVGEHHVGRQLVAATAQPVGQPGTEARPPGHAGDAGIHVADGNLVAVVPSVHASNQAEIVGNRGRVRQQFAEVHAALAVLFEFPRAAKQLAAGFVGEAVLHIVAVIRAVEAGQFRLGIG